MHHPEIMPDGTIHRPDGRLTCVPCACCGRPACTDRMTDTSPGRSVLCWGCRHAVH